MQDDLIITSSTGMGKTSLACALRKNKTIVVQSLNVCVQTGWLVPVAGLVARLARSKLWY